METDGNIETVGHIAASQSEPRSHRAEASPENGGAKSWASGIPPSHSALCLHVSSRSHYQ